MISLDTLKKTWFLAAIGHFMIELTQSYLPIALPMLKDKLDLSYAQMGLLPAVLVFCGAITQPLFGYLSDRWGARRMTILSVVWIGLLMGIVGFVGNYVLLLIVLAFGALGSAAFHPAAATLAMFGTSKNQGMKTSVFSVSGNIGVAVSPLLIAAAISLWGLPGTAIAIPLALITAWWLYRWLRENPQPEATTDPTHVKKATPVWLDTRLTILFTLMVVAVMSRSWFQVVLMNYLPEWLTSQDHSLGFASGMLSTMLFCIGAGGIAGGLLSDRIGRWQVLALSFVLLGPAHWLFMSVSGAMQFITIGVIGILIGATFPVALVMAKEIWPSRVGLATSIVMGLGWAPGSLGAWVTGTIADNFSLTVGLQTLVVVPLVGIICITAFALLHRRETIDSPSMVLDQSG